MTYENSIEFAAMMDEQDPLRNIAGQFYKPNFNGKEAIYLCGNSLGLQPIAAKQHVDKIFEGWKSNAIEGFFTGDEPWLGYHKSLTKTLSWLIGAKELEITVMNSLTVNLHLLMVSFYKLDSKRYKILMEGGAFPSDQYAFASQARFHGHDPKDAIIEVFPREGEFTLQTLDIVNAIEKNADELALVLFSGVNYFTGQYYDIHAITRAAHVAGAYAGFDLAHAAGNVPLKLHDWDVDFAAWCSYKYLNSGPGGISGIFVNEKHFTDATLPRFEGWWGYREDQRFLMTKEFKAENGAAGWQLSTSPIMLLALHKAALSVFEQIGAMDQLRAKSELLTGYLEYLIESINQRNNSELFKIITPVKSKDKGCQLSIICREKPKEVFKFLMKNSVIGDWREPNVIRLSPVPLYNSFKDVFEAGRILASFFDNN